ncbi:MAG: hypothetical protein JSU64_07445 [candidate division WOR-3 bacterium]|nr:MAG: hypothetical protein JSU64_07445 [candidate division WOR-3 bacterium]
MLLILAGVARGKRGEKADHGITHYDITVRIPETFDRMEVDALLELTKRSRAVIDRVDILIGKNFRGVKVVNVDVSDVRSEPVSFTFDDTLLCVDLSQGNSDGAKQWLLVEYDLVKDTSFYDEYSAFSFEISDSLCLVNASITRTDNWYPKIAGTMAERLAPFRFVIDVPERFEVMASGQLQDVVVDGGRKVFQWQNYEGVTDRSLYFFAQEQSRITKEFSDGLKVIMYAPEGAREENMDYLADLIHKSYRFFEKAYGDLPWEEYKIMSFAYGYSGLFNSSNAPTALFNAEIVNNDIYFPVRSVIHEVSHTWWGNVVSSNADENYWLYEGFGKYSEIVGIRPALGADVESLSFFRLKLCTLPYIDYVPSIKNSQDVDDIVLRTVSAYYMGATYLRMLKFVMGKDKFYAAIRDYVGRCRGKCIDTEDFISIMKRHCKKKYHALLKDYIMNPGYARYRMQKLVTKFTGKYYVHWYVIENVGDKDICVPYRVKSDLANYTRTFFLKQGQDLSIYVESEHEDAVDHVTIDPAGIHPVCRAGLKGAGATLYENQQGEVKAYNIIDEGPFGAAGITEDMSLLRLQEEELAGKGLEALNQLTLRPPGTEFVLLVRSGDTEPYEITVRY